jgi:copper chaperone CopZ
VVTFSVGRKNKELTLKNKKGEHQMEEKTVNVPKISCGHCVMTIKREVGELEGVMSVDRDENAKRVTITWDPPATWEKISGTLQELGYPAEV